MKILKILGLMIATVLSVHAVIYVADQGYLADYWEDRESLWDPRLKIFRCLDDQGQIDKADRQPPCSVITLAGQKLAERHMAKCLKAGGEAQRCTHEAWIFVYAMRPEERTKNPEEPRGVISRRAQ